MRFLLPNRLLVPILGAGLLFVGGGSAAAVEPHKGTFDKRPEPITTVPSRPRGADTASTMKRSPILGPKHYRVPRNSMMKRYNPMPSKRGGARTSAHSARGIRQR